MNPQELAVVKKAVNSLIKVQNNDDLISCQVGIAIATGYLDALIEQGDNQK